MYCVYVKYMLSVCVYVCNVLMYVCNVCSVCNVCYVYRYLLCYVRLHVRLCGVYAMYVCMYVCS